ncbi:MAG: TonB-dependent receptor [Alphaproteobacteria bacterium]|nr:TonB-dependent receptor [Alphaproteobacteria bacterium]
MRAFTGEGLKKSLFLGTSIAGLLLSGQVMAQQQGSGNETVIVTGTRVQGMTAADSAAPVQVLGSDALTRSSGTQDLRQSLGQTVPSFTSQSFGGDLSNLTRAANLRGLSPNDTLILVNGKRRHMASAFATGGGGFGGNSAPDLSMIPTAALDHVEVLLDGAAAQYGTDAISGVVNLILKKRSSGGTISVTGGRRYNTQGDSYDYSINMGLPLFDKGYVNLTFDKQYSNFVQLGGPDSRLIGADGVTEAQEGLIGVGATPGNNTFVANSSGVVPCTGGICIPLANRRGMTDYPRANHENTSPEINQTVISYNAGYDFSDTMQLYSFGTWGHRYGIGMQNVRMPSQIIATPGSNQPCSATNPQGYATGSSTQIGTTGVGTAPSCTGPFTLAGSIGAPGTPTAGINSRNQIISSGQAGTFYTPGELVLYPNGFQPQEAVKDTDYQYNLGLKAGVGGWDIDASISYGKDINDIYTLNSGNRALFIDTHTTPRNFYDGTFVASQFVGTVDVTRGFNVGMASPLNVAFGFEAREDMYQIKPGDAASQYKEGGQSFPGYSNAVAGSHSRKNYSAYLDFALAPVESVEIDIAGRAEHYTDFGDTQIGKITARWDITPQWAVRGTMSTGFRAPNLQEEWYNTVNVSPTNATIQLPADSAAAKILGFSDLKPEISTSFSAGIVGHPLDDLSLTIDAYSIALGDRISSSSTVYLRGGSPQVLLCGDAISALGLQLDPTATRVGCSSFVNGFGTLTQGVDFTVSYPTDFGDSGLIDWTLAGNYNSTKISRVAPVPPQLSAVPGGTFFTDSTLFNFAHAAPAFKIGLTGTWSLDAWGLTVRETLYGPLKALTSPDGSKPYFDNSEPSVGITDIEGRYNFTESVQLAIGGNNLFGIPAKGSCIVGGTNSSGGVNPCGGGVVAHSPVGTPFDPYGGYYYGRLTINW